MSKKINFAEYLMEMINLGDLTSQEKFAKAGKLYKKYNRGRLNYDLFIEQFELLEKEIGELPTISIIENLSEKMKDKYYEYLLGEYIQMSMGSLSQIFNLAIDGLFGEKVKTKDSSILDDIYSILTYEDIVNVYVKEWEINYNILVKPIFKRLGDLNHLPEKRKKYRHWEIEQVCEFLNSNDSLKKLTFFFEPMDTKVRNAFVHLDYFFDHERKTIILIDRKKKSNNWTEIPTNDIVMKSMRFKVNRLFLFVFIAKRLSDKLGLEWD